MPIRTRSPRDTTFDLVSCRDVLAKLGREISRASDAVHREQLADHCTNAAWTAWHLAEWVWADIKDNHCLKAALANDAGVKVRNFDRDAFLLYLQSEGQCPELAYLRIITITSKHVGADPDDDQTFVIAASAASTAAPTLDWQPIYDDGHRKLWTFKVVEDEDRSDVILWFQTVRDYWVRFIDGHDIARR